MMSKVSLPIKTATCKLID